MASKDAFDPDAYLAGVAEAPGGEFDPNAYLGSIPDASPQAAPSAPARPYNPLPGYTPDAMNPLPVFSTPQGGEVINRGVDMVKNMGLEGGGVALGQIAGSPLAQFGGVQAGGAIGGFLGNTAAQLTTPGKRYSLGEATGAAVAGMVPGVSLAKAGGKEIAKQAAKLGAANLAATNAASLIETGKPASLTEDVVALGAGGVAPFVQRGAESALGARGLVKTAEEATLEGQRNAFRAVRKYGIKVAPFDLGVGSDTISSMGGKAATQQAMAKDNVFGFQKMLNEANGIPDSALPLYDSHLEQIRKSNYAPYEKLKEIAASAKEKLDDIMSKAPKAIDGPSTAAREDFLKAKKDFIDPLVIQAGADVDALKIARHKAQAAYDRFKAGDPAAYGEWQGHIQSMDDLNEKILRAAALAGDKGLLKDLNRARRAIAITYASQDIINPATGLANPAAAGAKVLNREVGFRELENGIENTSPLKKMGDFAVSFYPESVQATRVPAPGVNNLNPNLRLGMLSQGTPEGLIAAGVSKLGAPARFLMGREFMQNRYARPQMTLGVPDIASRATTYATMKAGRK